MQIIVVDKSPPLRASLAGRVQESARQAGLDRIVTVDSDPVNLEEVDWNKTVGCLIGPGCGSMLREILTQLQTLGHNCPIGIVLDADTYALDGIALHKIIGKPVILETDLSHIAAFVIDCERASTGRPVGIKQRQVVSVVQAKGGVGGSTLAAALGRYWSSYEQSVILIDLDTVTAHLTEWSRATASKRQGVSEMIRRGGLTIEGIREVVVPIPNSGDKLTVFPQPAAFIEGTHLQTGVLADAIAPNDFLGSLLGFLASEYDIVVIDAGKGWGISTFTALQWCEKVLFVADDDGASVQLSLSALSRLRRESGDSDEFNMTKWVTALNRVSGTRVRQNDFRQLLDNSHVFPPEHPIFYVPDSVKGRLWGQPGITLYDLADKNTRSKIEELAEAIFAKPGAAKIANTNWLRKLLGG